MPLVIGQSRVPEPPAKIIPRTLNLSLKAIRLSHPIGTQSESTAPPKDMIDVNI